MFVPFSKTIFVFLFTCLVNMLYAQRQGHATLLNSTDSMTLRALDSTVYVIRNRKETLKQIATKLPTPKKALRLPYEVYLKEWNDILDENEFLEIGTAIKLVENVVMPTQKQLKLLTTLHPDIHIVTTPTENLLTICKAYNFKPIAGYDYYLYLKTWNNIEDEYTYLPIGYAIRLTEDATLPVREATLQRNEEYTNSESKLYYGNFESICKDKELKKLDLKDSYWDSLPPTLFKLTQLTELCLGTTKLANLPTQIEKLTNLSLLYLHNNLLVRLPEQLGNLSTLKGLYLENNKLDSLPSQLSYLSNLTYLTLQHNRLKFLPKEIGRLENLQSLNSSSNLLTTLPKELGNLQKLKRLVVSNNKLTKFPSEIRQLSKLKDLTISNNPLTKTEINKILLALPQLEILYLGNLGLHTLPSAVFSLRHLKKLDLINYASPTKKANLFSAKEKQQIRKLLPTCEILFE